MDALVLPVLVDEDTVDEALNRMAQLGSRAIVVRNHARYTLYRNRAVVKAWAAEEPTCAQLVTYGGEATAVLDLWGIQTSTGSIGQLIEQQLDRSGGAQFGVLVAPRPEDKAMFVVTRHETKRDEIAYAGLECACNGPRRHPASSPPAALGGPCAVCGFMYSCW